jgi:hypothetical protein
VHCVRENGKVVLVGATTVDDIFKKKKRCEFTILSPISSTNVAGRPRLGSP